MKALKYFCIILLIGVQGLSAQLNNGDSLKGKYFEYSVDINGKWGDLKVKTSKTYHIAFFESYKSYWECDFSEYWKCYPEYKIYQFNQLEYIQVPIEEMLNEKRDEILERILDKVQKGYNLGLGAEHDCFINLDSIKTLTWKDLSCYFNRDGITYSYYFDAGGYCDAYNWSTLFLTWDEAIPYLNVQSIETRAYGSPVRNNVKVRDKPNQNSRMLFSLREGDIFEILEVAQSHHVKGKKGNWLKIQLKENTGYIFSGDMNFSE